jgi:polyphenol oxidase
MAMKKKNAKPKKALRKIKPKRTVAPAPKGWKWQRRRGVQILKSQALEKLPRIVHGFSTRIGGASKLGNKSGLNLGFTDWDKRTAVEKNRKSFASALGANKMQMVALKQIHSDVIHRIDRIPAEALRGDALITNTPGILLSVQTADCVPILLADKRGRAIAAIHAGWRGTVARIVAKTVGRMQMEFGIEPADILAAIGPAIGQCSYEVGSDVAKQFASQFGTARDWFDGPYERVIDDDAPNPLKWLLMTPPGHDPPLPTVNLDLIAANRWQLKDAGVPDKNVSAANLCTACNTNLFFSYRRESGGTGRLMAAIGISE